MNKFLSSLWPRKAWQQALALGIPVVIIGVALVIMTFGGGDPTPEETFVMYDPEIDAPPIEEPPEEEPPEEPEEPEEPEDLRPLALLTGIHIDEEYATRRPIAVVINNIHEAQPQSGIASADIIYEVLAEGHVTRFVAVFQSYIPEEIGPVRSARDYFVDFAFNHDAIFVHHGSSPTGTNRINSTRITALDGMRLEGRVFWRDRDNVPAWHRNRGRRRAMEHSSYTSQTRLLDHIADNNIRDYISEDHESGFTFGEVPLTGTAGIAERVVVPFSSTTPRIFIFDEETGLYMVEYHHGEHRDAITQEQLAVANVLIQLTNIRVVDGVGRRNVQTVGEGEGYFVTAGRYRPVRWVKESHTAPMRWYFEDGIPLILAPGTTWICVFSGTVEFGAAD